MVLVALHGHWRCEVTRIVVVPGQATSCATCTLYTRKKACQGTTTVLVALHGHWRCEATRTLAVPGQATSCGGVTCTLYTRLGLGRKLVKEPPRFWTPCTATAGARRSELWWFLDKPPHAAHAVGRPVHCTLASAGEEACQGTTTVLVALHGHWRCEATRTLVVPGQATSCGGATCTL